ncbi:MAG: DUF2254 domain-containing protein [Renibacterium salmoninarum]|nr:DUF2254 domain-containing protein [Renibacterium salmoninarum]
MSGLLLRLRRAVESFWFVPALVVLLAIILAEVVVGIDRAVVAAGLRDQLDWLDVVSASGGRDILGAVAGSILAVAATSFSITISVLATASSTYGPRLVRNFMSDRGNQLVLGSFGATFVYALLVLRTIRDPSQDGGAFVPALAIMLAVLIAIADVAILVYFINHIADSVQVSTLSERVKKDLIATVARLYPAEPADCVTEASGPRTGLQRTAHPLHSGYVQEVDESGLLRWAQEHDLVIEVRAQVGDHLIESEPLAVSYGEGGDAEQIRRFFTVDDARTPFQDLRFAVQQLEEMAVRALSPSTNDPYTACNALAELGPGLTLLAARADSALGREDSNGNLRLIVSRADLGDVIDSVFSAIRRNGIDHPPVLLELVKLGNRIITAAAANRSPVGPELASRVQRQLRLLRQNYRDHNPDADDLAGFEAKLPEGA